MDLGNLKPAKGSTKKRKRLGRGVGSGHGGHSSTRGDKGQKSRSGANIPAWFEGGQMPLQRRIPKFGFTNRNRTEYRVLNVSRLAELVAAGRLDASQPVTPSVLIEAGLANKSDLIKILGGGTLDAALQVSAHAFSKAARRKIEEAGGQTTVLK
ncbi:MAG: 50S ribosomal protein L15 [Rhodothermales bacterium]